MNKIKTAQQAVIDWDMRGCIYLNHWSANHYVALTFKTISRMGDGLFWLTMLLVVLLLNGLSYIVQIMYLVCASSLGTLSYRLLKTHTIRPRPYQVHQVIKLGERPLDHFSFPSGHTLHAVMITILLGSIVPPLLFIMLPFTLLIALSRMILGLHYPTDVLVGAALGAAIAVIALYLAPHFGVML